MSNKQSSIEVIDMQTLDEMNKFVNILYPNFMLYMIARVHNYVLLMIVYCFKLIGILYKLIFPVHKMTQYHALVNIDSCW